MKNSKPNPQTRLSTCAKLYFHLIFKIYYIFLKNKTFFLFLVILFGRYLYFLKICFFHSLNSYLLAIATQLNIPKEISAYVCALAFATMCHFVVTHIKGNLML